MHTAWTGCDQRFDQVAAQALHFFETLIMSDSLSAHFASCAYGYSNDVRCVQQLSYCTVQYCTGTEMQKQWQSCRVQRRSRSSRKRSRCDGCQSVPFRSICCLCAAAAELQLQLRFWFVPFRSDPFDIDETRRAAPRRDPFASIQLNTQRVPIDELSRVFWDCSALLCAVLICCTTAL